MKKQLLSFFTACILGTFSFSSAAALYVCENGSCSYTEKGQSVQPWIPKVYAFFKARNARIDFCEADPKSHACLTEGLNWYANSPMFTAFFSIPVARTLPQQNSLLVDYLVKVNEYLPTCNFAISTVEETEKQALRLVSHAFSCQITDFGKTQLQNSFFIDYVDLDNKVLGAKYIIQTSGAIKGNSAGYTLMKFRDGQTLLPLVVEPYYGEEPNVPEVPELRQLARQDAASADAFADGESDYKVDYEHAEHPLVEGVRDWWAELKYSINLDKPKTTKVQEDDHWWTKFTNKLMKIIYLEPLE